MAVPDAVAESADPEELEVVLRRVDLFSTRRAEFSTLPFPHWQYFSLPANPRENAVGTAGNAFVCEKSLEGVRASESP